MTQRTKLPADTLAECLEQDLLAEIKQTTQRVADFIRDYEMPAGSIQNCQYAHRALTRASAAITSSITFALAEVDG